MKIAIPQHRPAPRRQRRRAVTLVESAIVLWIALVLLLGMLELSIALVRHTVMSEAARRVARAAIVHGAKSSAALGAWGPAPVSVNAASSHPVAAAAAGMLMTLPPADVSIEVRWLDGDNQPDQRVQVTVSYVHRPLVPIPGWYRQLNLQGVSTMRIAH